MKTIIATILLATSTMAMAEETLVLDPWDQDSVEDCRSSFSQDFPEYPQSHSSIDYYAIKIDDQVRFVYPTDDDRFQSYEPIGAFNCKFEKSYPYAMMQDMLVKYPYAKMHTEFVPRDTMDTNAAAPAITPDQLEVSYMRKAFEIVDHRTYSNVTMFTITNLSDHKLTKADMDFDFNRGHCPKGHTITFWGMTYLKDGLDFGESVNVMRSNCKVRELEITVDGQVINYGINN